MPWDYNRCVSLFNDEIVLIKKIFSVEDSVQKAVIAKEWADFNQKTAEINQLGEDFIALEEERVGLFADLRKKLNMDSADPSFYSMAAKLPSEESRVLTALYRELKMETLKVKVLNETFTEYVNEIKTMAVALLDAFFPANGKLYTHKGRQASRDLRSMVFNQSI